MRQKSQIVFESFYFFLKVQRATVIANTHAVTKPHTWTAQLWLSIVSCSSGPLSFLTGIHADDFARLRPEAATAVLTSGQEAVSDAISEVKDVKASATTALDGVTDSAKDVVTSIPSEVPLSKAAESFFK